jgi:hypothetical protein
MANTAAMKDIGKKTMATMVNTMIVCPAYLGSGPLLLPRSPVQGAVLCVW